MGRPKLTEKQAGKSSVARQNYDRQYYEDNYVAILAKNKDWGRRNPDKIASYGLKYRTQFPWRSRHNLLLRRFGITLAQWFCILLLQRNCCAICEISYPGPRGWATDHNPSKQKGDVGYVRGILCMSCNIIFGHVKEDAAHLHKLVHYLEKHR